MGKSVLNHAPQLMSCITCMYVCVKCIPQAVLLPQPSLPGPQTGSDKLVFCIMFSPLVSDYVYINARLSTTCYSQLIVTRLGCYCICGVLKDGKPLNFDMLGHVQKFKHSKHKMKFESLSPPAI